MGMGTAYAKEKLFSEVQTSGSWPSNVPTPQPPSPSNTVAVLSNANDIIWPFPPFSLSEGLFIFGTEYTIELGLKFNSEILVLRETNLHQLAKWMTVSH